MHTECVRDCRDRNQDRPIERQQLHEDQIRLRIGAEPPRRQPDHPRRLPHRCLPDDDRGPTEPKRQAPARAELSDMTLWRLEPRRRRRKWGRRNCWTRTWRWRWRCGGWTLRWRHRLSLR